MAKTVIGVLLFYQGKNRKKTNKKLQLLNSELEIANKTKARFFSILNHDLRSPVSNLIHFLHLQKEHPELLTGESKTRLESKIIHLAEQLLVSMEDILIWSKGQMENFKIKNESIAIDELFQSIKQHFLSEEKTTIVFEMKELLTINCDINYLKTIMRNLTSNAIKATADVNNATITWKAWQENDKMYLSIADNGIGVNDEKLKALYDETQITGIQLGLGLHLIRDMAKLINCTITLHANQLQGTKFVLKII